jgi:hypothetical protein
LKAIRKSFNSKLVLLCIVFFFSFLALPFFIGYKIAFSSESNLSGDPYAVLNRYGEIIYQSNGKNQQQIYVIGMSHRDSITGQNGRQTSQVQAEVYKIGEWLICNRELELLLPEGYFEGKGGKIENENLMGALDKKRDGPGSFDMDTLEEILSDNRRFINAEMLLREHYPSLEIRQVEDWSLYEAARKRIGELINQKSSCDYPLLKSELDYLQERRTAAILQRIPEIVDEEFQLGNIKARKAMLTIGMHHAHQIIQYLHDHKVIVYSSPDRSGKGEDYIAELNLDKEKFGVTIILPRALADNQRILELNHLDKIVAQYRNRSFSPPSVFLP